MSSFKESCITILGECTEFLALNLVMLIAGIALIFVGIIPVPIIHFVLRASIAIGIGYALTVTIGFISLPWEDVTILKVFTGLLVFFALLQLILGVLSICIAYDLVFDLEGGAEEIMAEMFKNCLMPDGIYTTTDQYEKAKLFDAIQRELGCCGIINTDDWRRKGVEWTSPLPATCCAGKETRTCTIIDDNFIQVGCAKAYANEYRRVSLLVGAIFLAMMIPVIIAIIFGFKEISIVGLRVNLRDDMSRLNYYSSLGLISLVGTMELELVMPKYAVRGGNVVLKCIHNVHPEQLYKVEWQKGGTKIFQYIKGRVPPFRYFPSAGFHLSRENSSEKQIQLSKLDFSASGSYSCVVSMETPIFSKDSESHVLTVIEPQERDPLITFNKNTYEIGEILEANCTAGPSRPPPYITWLINDLKVFDSLTRSFSPSRSTNTAVGIGYFEQRATSTKQLSIEVSDLHVGDNGQLWLTCLATIPGYVGQGEEYADSRNHSVRIVIEMQEEPAEPILNNNSQIKQINDFLITHISLAFVILASN